MWVLFFLYYMCTSAPVMDHKLPEGKSAVHFIHIHTSCRHRLPPAPVACESHLSCFSVLTYISLCCVEKRLYLPPSTCSFISSLEFFPYSHLDEIVISTYRIYIHLPYYLPTFSYLPSGPHHSTETALINSLKHFCG